MRILVTAYHVSGDVSGGGSSRFMKCVVDTLLAMGHEVIATADVHSQINVQYDIIICSHVLSIIQANPSWKVNIAHGIIGDEYMIPGADRYIAISEEVREFNEERGYVSEVIGQPIPIGKYAAPSKNLKKILVIGKSLSEFAFLSERYEVRMSDPAVPIEKQIKWADLCITLGRGALESMALGTPVLVADNRHYIGSVGDGYLTTENIKEVASCNFSGRKFRIPLSQEWIEEEVSKYNPAGSRDLYEYVKENHDALKVVEQYLERGIND